MTDPIIDRTRTALRELGARRGPIIVGPWLSEVGFELLYWVPFLRWAVQFAGLRADDLWVVSRGGPKSWYQDIGAHYIDVFDFYTPEAFRSDNERRIVAQASRWQSLGLRSDTRSPKQQEVSDFDRAIIAKVCSETGIDAPRLLHPSLMYRFFRPFWKHHVPDLYTKSTRVARLTPPQLLSGLPESYVAMKFYASNAFDRSHQSVAQDIVHAQAQVSDVVLLHSGERYDDHGDLPIEPHPRVHHVTLPPDRNLEVQTAVMAGASSFIGTYGGFAYLAPFLGVPTLALFGRASFRKDHLNLMRSLAQSSLKVEFEAEPIGRGLTTVLKRARRRAA